VFQIARMYGTESQFDQALGVDSWTFFYIILQRNGSCIFTCFSSLQNHDTHVFEKLFVPDKYSHYLYFKNVDYVIEKWWQ